MKRILSFILLALILLTALPAAAASSAAAVTVDGVRIAFFDENGAYLPPIEENGVVYVPVLSLAESLKLSVTADAATLAVTINGVRTAFFDESGAYLPPLAADGTVYVPLAAFAQSAGIPLTVEGGTYALSRAEEAVPEAEALPTPRAHRSAAGLRVGRAERHQFQHLFFLHLGPPGLLCMEAAI